MQPNLLMVSWAVGFFPTAVHRATVCCAGSFGEGAFRRSLDAGYPEGAFLLSGSSADGTEAVSRIAMFLPVSSTTAASHRRVSLIPEFNVFQKCMAALLHKDLHLRIISGTARRLPDCFLSGCHRVRSITFELPSLEELPTGFLRHCSGLVSLDLGSFEGMNSLPELFLENCTGLSRIDLSPFSAITEIPPQFLRGCTGLVEIDLTPLTNIVKISRGFLFNCTNLTVLDLSPLHRIHTIPEEFVNHCSGLLTVDMSSLQRVRHPKPRDFLLGCNNAVNLLLPPHLSAYNLNDDDKDEIQMLDNNWLTQGPNYHPRGTRAHIERILRSQL